MLKFLRRAFAGDQRPRQRNQSSWQRIGDNYDTAHIPSWVLTRFANEPGSHGTRLIDYPEPGMRLEYKGGTYRYQIRMGDQSWEVHRRLRKRARRRSRK